MRGRVRGRATVDDLALSDGFAPELLTRAVVGLGTPDADARLLSLVVSCDVRWARDHARA